MSQAPQNNTEPHQSRYGALAFSHQGIGFDQKGNAAAPIDRGATVITFPAGRPARTPHTAQSRDRANGSNIVELHGRRAALPRPLAAQTINGRESRQAGLAADDDGRRILENGIAGAALLGLIAAGYWALSTLAMAS